MRLLAISLRHPCTFLSSNFIRFPVTSNALALVKPLTSIFASSLGSFTEISFRARLPRETFTVLRRSASKMLG